MLTTQELADEIGRDVNVVRAWTRRGALTAHRGSYSDDEVEIARVLVKLPEEASTITLRRIAGVLRNALERDDGWKGLALAWPESTPAGVRVVPADAIPANGRGVVAVVVLG